MNEVADMLNFMVSITGKHHEVTDQYKKLKTDQERIIFTLNVMQEYDVVPSTTDMPKNAKESEKLREQGNKVFVKGTFNNMTCIDALKLYTKCIAFAPYPSEQLALGYANRSAVLFQLSLHSECIQDIDRALVLNYPDNLKVKLYLRKTECSMILGNRSVEDVLKEAQHWLDKMSINDTNREKLKAKLDVLHDKTGQTELCASMNTEAKALEKQLLPLPIIECHNDEVPCASNAVAIKYNERYGRHVVATRNIRPGEIIAIEKPYSLLLYQQYMQMHCSNCLRVSWANIPCNYCTYAMYCSEECRNIEWKKYHDVECALVPALIEYTFYDPHLLISIRVAVLALREVGGIEELRMMLKEVDKCDDPRTKGFSQDGKLHSDKYISVYSLMTNTEKRSVSGLLRTALDASFISYFLATRTVIFGAKLLEDLSALAKNDDVTFFGGLILRHQQIILTNSHAFAGKQGSETVKLGPAVMPFLSLINHGCNPNILRQTRPKHMVIYATFPIRKGEQLLDSYGPSYATTSRAMRPELLEQYYFTCDCIPCQEDWPTYHELQSYKTLVKRPEDKSKIKKALIIFDKSVIRLRTAGNVQDKPYIIEKIMKMVQVLHDCAPMPCKEMTNVFIMLQRIYNLDGNRFEIPQVWTYRK